MSFQLCFSPLLFIILIDAWDYVVCVGVKCEVLRPGDYSKNSQNNQQLIPAPPSPPPYMVQLIYKITNLF